MAFLRSLVSERVKEDVKLCLPGLKDSAPEHQTNWFLISHNRKMGSISDRKSPLVNLTLSGHQLEKNVW